jgi:lipopolysaccharide transport system permease protein
MDQMLVSLVANTNLLTKVYFPRLILPLASLGRGLVDFMISMVLLLILMLFYRTLPGIAILLFPFFLLMGLLIIFGIGLFASALCAKYRDVKFAFPFLMQMWFWVTPIAYGLENIPDDLRPFFYLNPMTWVIEGIRRTMLGVGQFNGGRMVMIGLLTICIFFAGLFYFRRTEGILSDII